VRPGEGSIVLNMRNDHERYRAVNVASDLGKTWQAHPTNRQTLIEPNCNGSLYRVDSEAGDQRRHDLLFANPHNQQRRTHQTIQVSYDDGQTWLAEHHLLPDAGLGRGYPSITRADDNHIGIVYEGSTADLAFERIPLARLVRHWYPMQ
jgi:sialidase-1